jgi:hypothetical protein
MLEALNRLLKTTDLGLPKFRTVVSHGGSNLAWLRKTLRPRSDVPAPIRDMVEHSIVVLATKPYIGPCNDDELGGTLSAEESQYAAQLGRSDV